MAQIVEGQTTISYFSFPTSTSCVIELAVPNFSFQAEREYTRSDVVTIGHSQWSLVVRSKIADGGSISVKAYIKTHGPVDNGEEYLVEIRFSIEHHTTADGLDVIHTRVGRGDEKLLFSKGKSFLCFDTANFEVPGCSHLTYRVRILSAFLVLKPATTIEMSLTGSLLTRNRKMYDCPIGRDFLLISSDSTELPVHKAILAASSPVFQRMLETNMEESTSGRCIIEDICTGTLDALVRYMYYSGLENLKEVAVELLQATEKYEMPELKEHCEVALIADIKMDNMVELLVLADKFSAAGLKEAVLQFILANFDSAVSTGQVAQIMESDNVSLATELLVASVNLRKK